MKFDIHYLLAPRYAKWIIISAISLLSLLILFEYASLFFPLTAQSESINTQTSPEQSTKQQSPNYLLNSALFGVYVPNDLNEDQVKKSMLNVTLVGILQADKPEESQAIIKSASGEEKSYKVGDKIPGGALIKRIMAVGVLVEHNGTLESLSLPKNDLIFEPAPKPLKEE